MLENLGTTPEVRAIQKHHQSKNKCLQSSPRSTSDRKSSSQDTGGKKCDNWGHSHLPKQCPAYGKECFKCKKKNHFSKLCWNLDKKPGGGGGNPKCFSRKDIHELGKTKFEYDTDIMEFNGSSFQYLCLTSVKILQTLRISCLMKCHSQGNYTMP